MGAAAVGIVGLLVMQFVIVAPNRLRTGAGVSLPGALGWGWSAVLLGGWVAIAALSIRRDGARPAARGIVALALALGAIALCQVAAVRLLSEAGPFSRVSLGGGAWVSSIAAYAVVLSSRREIGSRTAAGVALGAGVPAGLGLMFVTGYLSDLGMVREYSNLSGVFWSYVGNTVVLAAAALAIATVVGLGLGMLAFRGRRYERPIFAVVNAFQTIPGLAMVGLLFAPLAWLRRSVPLAASLGIGGLDWAPVVVALTLYALLAITRNTYAGLKSVPADVVESGVGMGMTPAQVMWRIRVPLALPVLFSGERTAAVQTIGNATLGAFVAAFTLGTVIFGGLSQQALDLTMLGSVTLVALAMLGDGLMRALQTLVSPRHSGPARDAS